MEFRLQAAGAEICALAAFRRLKAGLQTRAPPGPTSACAPCRFGHDPRMTKFVVLTFLFCTAVSLSAAEVLIVADEFPAMEYLSGQLKAMEKLTSKVVSQKELPSDLSPFSAVIVYIHLDLQEPVEKALIQYTTNGGKLIALHHSISSGKRKNKKWFGFLGVSLPQGDVDQGGYKWIEPATLEVVKAAPDHFITTNQVRYPARIPWQDPVASTGLQEYPGIRLPQSEVYLNHVLTEPRTLLLGFRYADAPSGKVYCQSHAGWIRPAGKGWLVYLMPGHSQRDFEEPAYLQIVANAVAWKP
jgi:hypothetical protein